MADSSEASSGGEEKNSVIADSASMGDSDPHILLIGRNLQYIEEMIAPNFKVTSTTTGEMALIRLGFKHRVWRITVADPEMTESSDSSSDDEEKKPWKRPKLSQRNYPDSTTYSATVCKGGHQKTLIETHYHLPDLILCQFFLPPSDNPNGIQLLQKAKGHIDTRDIPFIMLLAADDKDSDQKEGQCLKVGAAEVLMEPLSLDEVTRLVKNLGGGG